VRKFGKRRLTLVRCTAMPVDNKKRSEMKIKVHHTPAITVCGLPKICHGNEELTYSMFINEVYLPIMSSNVNLRVCHENLFDFLAKINLAYVN
jgi:hypothetical protein